MLVNGSDKASVPLFLLPTSISLYLGRHNVNGTSVNNSLSASLGGHSELGHFGSLKPLLGHGGITRQSHHKHVCTLHTNFVHSSLSRMAEGHCVFMHQDGLQCGPLRLYIISRILESCNVLSTHFARNCSNHAPAVGATPSCKQAFSRCRHSVEQ